MVYGKEVQIPTGYKIIGFYPPTGLYQDQWDVDLEEVVTQLSI